MLDRMSVSVLSLVIIIDSVLLYFVGENFYILAKDGRYLFAIPALIVYMGVTIVFCASCGNAWERLKKKYTKLEAIFG